MRGNIYSRQKCPVCGRSFKYRDDLRALVCPDHQEQHANGQFYIKFGRQINKRCQSFQDAERLLTGMRYEVDRGTFDVRDYHSTNPLGFYNLACSWLLVKEQEVKPSSYRSLNRFMNAASDSWGNRNIKEIGFAEIEDFLFSQQVSNKTRSNIRSCLHTFWKWLLHRRVITLSQFPEFPVVKYKLGYRKVVDKTTQSLIVDEVYRISYHLNARIWLGIKWLCTYIAFRPGELLQLREQDINTKIGAFILPPDVTKEGSQKIVPMLESDKQLIDDLPVGLPDLPFFRHGKGVSGCRPGQPFGEKYLYKWWKKACNNLDIEGVDLYGGTRHSSATALKDHLSPEQIKIGTMHQTNKAFERYFQRNSEDAIEVYSLTEVHHECTTKEKKKKVVTYRN